MSFMSALFDDVPNSKVLPEDYKAGILDYIWYDEQDRRYCLDGPLACSQEDYYSTKQHFEFMEKLKKNPNAPAPEGYPPEIEAEDRYIAQLEREGK